MKSRCYKNLLDLRYYRVGFIEIYILSEYMGFSEAGDCEIKMYMKFGIKKRTTIQETIQEKEKAL